MSEEQKNLEMETTEKKLLRPALIASAETISEYSIFLKHLLVGLVDESIPTALICPPNCNLGSIVPPSVQVIRYPTFDLPLFKRQNRNKLVEQLNDFKPTVLHCLCQSEAPLARQLAWRLDLPYLLMVTSLQKRFGRLFISSSRCAKIIVPAETIAANVAKLYPAFTDRIKRINIGTFTSETSSCFRESRWLASMVTAHPLDNERDFENLFGAVKHLAIDGYEFMLVISGSGRAEKQVWKLLTARGLAQIVTFVPRLEMLRSVLAAGDIFIQPKPSNTFNPLLLEAMSVGAAVAGCKGGVDDLIIEDKTAIVFDPTDELSIYGTLQKLFDRRELAQKIATAAQQYLRENYTVSNMISSTLQAYHDAQTWFKHRGRSKP
ncbi:MAG: glycosyltransferase family 4 protein [Phycisphaerae bacterium]|nr:glycosyltransferase family 4 protein [Phycisphaerae bacterium]MDD5381997.1 glycosyltransferase family 4 protein [Phycisphaerae bacterium]